MAFHPRRPPCCQLLNVAFQHSCQVLHKLTTPPRPPKIPSTDSSSWPSHPNVMGSSYCHAPYDPHHLHNLVALTGNGKKHKISAQRPSAPTTDSFSWSSLSASYSSRVLRSTPDAGGWNESLIETTSFGVLMEALFFLGVSMPWIKY